MPSSIILPGQSWRGYTALQVCQKLGLASNLVCALDTGASGSYDGSSQTWTNLVGGGTDFFRGDDGTSEADDPTFNGTAGRLSGSEYFSTDGGGKFLISGGNTTYINGLHKSGAQWTIGGWIYTPTGLGTTHGYYGTTGTDSSAVGVSVRAASGAAFLSIQNGSIAILSRSTPPATDDAWNCWFHSLDADGGDVIGYMNGTANTSSAAGMSSGSASNATYAMQMLTRGNNAAIMAANARLAVVWMFNVPLTANQMNAIFAATQGRFSV